MPRRRFRLRFLAALLVVGLAAPHGWAWYHLRAAKSRLAKYHPETARTALDACLKVWPERSSVRLLASRAARQAGDFDAAERELRAAQRLNGGSSEEIAFEWALLQAAGGNVREVDEYLQKQAERSKEHAALAWEALVDGYLRLYRVNVAMACLDHWLARDPNNVRAIELRGITYVTGKGVQRGAEDFRRVLELDPNRPTTRVRLSICLLDLGSYSEALPLLEQLARERPGDVEVTTRLARCFQMLGRPDDALRTLDEALKLHPDNGRALRTRGQFSLSSNPPQLADAERYLARAAAALPDDYQAQWFYAEVLRLQGRADESRAQVKKAEEVKERAERVVELRSRKLAEQPLDPALHVEMGTLLTRTGHADAGARWMLSALTLDPDFRPAHAALAEHYDKVGDKARAADHRRAATK